MPTLSGEVSTVASLVQWFGPPAWLVPGNPASSAPVSPTTSTIEVQRACLRMAIQPPCLEALRAGQPIEFAQKPRGTVSPDDAGRTIRSVRDRQRRLAGVVVGRPSSADVLARREVLRELQGRLA